MANRELDAEVDHVVFGREKSELEPMFAEWGYWDGNDFVALPYYSSDIEAAWAVVEKLELFAIANGPEGWLCRFGVKVHPGGPWAGGAWTIVEVDARGETAPLAICRAALLAVKKKTPAQEP